jgi:antitoxin VapB
LFKNGGSVAVRLPKSCVPKSDEMVIRKIGEMIIMCPKDKVLDLFYEAVGNFTDDFFEAVSEFRKNDAWQEREQL